MMEKPIPLLRLAIERSINVLRLHQLQSLLRLIVSVYTPLRMRIIFRR